MPRLNELTAAQAAERHLVGSKVICKRYGICLSTLHNWVREKKIPCYRIGGRDGKGSWLRFSIEQCDRALEKFLIKAVGN